MFEYEKVCALNDEGEMETFATRTQAIIAGYTHDQIMPLVEVEELVLNDLLDEDEDDDEPEEGKTYTLIGGPGTPCIANGDTWADSEVS